ncbi:MAG: PAS domain-containing protein, partial [Phycisphaerae bacterium]|nr:PAS domain-containing protein [Phycisphaerae bacterium]
TERKRAEEAVRRSEKLLNVAQRLAKVGGWEWDVKKETMYWTDEVYQIHELHQGDLTTVNECLERSLECYDPQDRPVVMGAFERCKEKGEGYDLEFPFTTAKGHRIWIRTIAEPFMEDGRVTKVVGYLMDITERMKSEAEQERLIEELEEKNTELERYTYTVSHDLRSPLVTINGFVSVLQEDALNGDTEQMEVDVNHIKTAIKKMSALLNDLLELSKIGRVFNPLQETSLYDLTGEVLESLSFLIKEKNVKVNLSSRLPVVLCDRQRLGEVMQNLIENAVKYMGDQPAPQIDIGVRQEAQGCVIYVRDNGIGIEPRYNENIFGLFNQLDQSREGTGVGLAIVKRIVELHGGKVWVESEGEGKGATFCFTLPGNDGPK